MQELASAGIKWKIVALRAAALAAVFCMNSFIVLASSRYTGGFAAFWSANACLVFVLIISPKQEHPYYLATTFLASLGVNLSVDFSPSVDVAFSLSNILEAWLACRIMQRLGIAKSGMFSPAEIVQFGVVAAFVSAVSASTSLLGGTTSPLKDWMSWFASDLLGLMIFLPCFTIIHGAILDGNLFGQLKIKRLEFAVLTLLNAAFAVSAFCQASVPLLFLTAMPMMVLVFRFGALGAILSTLIIAVIAEAFTIGGYGPIASLEIENLAKVFLLQLFIASQLLIALPVASVLADRQKKVDQILEDERLLRVAAEKAQRDAERAEQDKIRLLATDELTGLASRRYVMEICERALQHAQKNDACLSVAIFDADHFKMLNDRYGHAKGDEVLAMIGQVVRQSINDAFTVGRIGGEEFLIVMPDANGIAAEAIVEQLRLDIAKAKLPNSDIGTTISVGLASFDKACELKVLLRRADQALYAAKRAGRDRFAVAA